MLLMKDELDETIYYPASQRVNIPYISRKKLEKNTKKIEKKVKKGLTRIVFYS